MDSREPREDHELAAFRKWARQVSVAFVNLSGGGSEMFTRIGNEFYVDPDPCAARIKEKIDAARLRRPSPVAESTPTDATAVEAEREGVSAAFWLVFDHVSKLYRTDEPQARELDRALTRISAHVGVSMPSARTPKES